MLTDPHTIAKGLTKAQREAVQGRFTWASIAEQEDGEALYRLGLWNPKPKYGQKAITPLGLAVRQALKEMEP